MPVLQNDTRQATYSTEQAERLLFGGTQPLNNYRQDVASDNEIATNFNTSHNLDAYKDLVQSRYPDSAAVFSPAQPMFSPYATTDTRAQTDVFEKPELDTYYTPDTNQKVEFETQFTSYYNDDNPLPAAYKPRIYDRNLQEVDTTTANPNTTGSLNLLGDFDVDFATDTAVAEKQDIAEATDFVPAMKLNAKGLIAVCCFFAVAALIIALIVINSFSIGSAASRISDLRAENQAVTVELQNNVAARENLYNATTKQITQQVTTSSEWSKLPNAKKLPNLKTWEKVVNQDVSTNLFDVLSKFLSGIFH